MSWQNDTHHGYQMPVVGSLWHDESMNFFKVKEVTRMNVYAKCNGRLYKRGMGEWLEGFAPAVNKDIDEMMEMI